MENATHFIEVYGLSNQTPKQSISPLTILELNYHLATTASFKFYHTIAIFKIKFKHGK
jgi:hypothetical protein